MKPLLSLVGLSLLLACSDATSPTTEKLTVWSDVINVTTLRLNIEVEGVPGMAGRPEFMDHHLVQASGVISKDDILSSYGFTSLRFKTEKDFACPITLQVRVLLINTVDRDTVLTESGSASC